MHHKVCYMYISPINEHRLLCLDALQFGPPAFSPRWKNVHHLIHHLRHVHNLFNVLITIATDLSPLSGGVNQQGVLWSVGVIDYEVCDACMC